MTELKDGYTAGSLSPCTWPMHKGRGSRRSCRPHGKTASLPSRQVLEGWQFVTKEGCSWGCFGTWQTVSMRRQGRIDNGVLERVFSEL